MAGLLGYGGAQNGILGGYQQQTPDWAQKLGLFSAAIKDAANSFSGQGDTNSLATWQQGQQGNQIRQQLMGALNSPDPTVRQQGYQALTMMGGDPSAFQKQQATQQLPQLLQSMRPSQQTLNSTSAPLPGGGNVTAAPINFEAPGLNISDAIGQAPPELQSMYAPKLIDEELKGPKYQEVGGGLYQLPGLGGGQPQQVLPPPLKAPTTRTVRQGNQEITQEWDTKTGAWKQVAAGSAWKPDAAPPALPGMNGSMKPLEAYPPQTQATVKAMLEGRQAPPSSFALSKPYWQELMALANSADPTFDQTAWGARASARKDMLGGGQSYKTLNAGNTAIQHLGRLHSQIGDVAGHQIPLIGNMLNSAQNAVEQQSGIPGMNAYNDTLGHLAEETTKFYRQTGGAEADVTRNMGNLAANLSTEQKQAGTANTVHLIYGKLAPMVEQYNKTMGTNYPTSHFLSKEAAATIKKMGFDPDSGEAAAPAQAAAPKNAPTGTTQTKVIGGKTYYLIDGKWHQ